MSTASSPARGFSLVELMIVVSIVGILITLLLPTLGSARDEARRVKCQSNLRQLFGFSKQFTADNKGNTFPAWYYATRPNGPRRGEVRANQTGIPFFNWSYRHAWHMLIDKGYLTEGERVVPVAGTEYARYRAHARTSMLACPNAYAPGSAADDSPADFVPVGVNVITMRPSPWQRKTMLARFTAPTGNNPPEGSFLKGGGYLSNYQVSMHAGSFQFYHDMTINAGLYPRKMWQWPSAPSRIGYMFESGDFGVNHNHTPTAYSRTANSWSTGWGGNYNPHTPHSNYTRNNFVFLDGSFGQMQEDYTGLPFPFVFQ